MNEREFSYNSRNPLIHMGKVHGILKKHEGKTQKIPLHIKSTPAGKKQGTHNHLSGNPVLFPAVWALPPRRGESSHTGPAEALLQGHASRRFRVRKRFFQTGIDFLLEQPDIAQGDTRKGRLFPRDAMDLELSGQEPGYLDPAHLSKGDLSPQRYCARARRETHFCSIALCGSPKMCGLRHM